MIELPVINVTKFVANLPIFIKSTNLIPSPTLRIPCHRIRDCSQSASPYITKKRYTISRDGVLPKIPSPPLESIHANYSVRNHPIASADRVSYRWTNREADRTCRAKAFTKRTTRKYAFNVVATRSSKKKARKKELARNPVDYSITPRNPGYPSGSWIMVFESARVNSHHLEPDQRLTSTHHRKSTLVLRNSVTHDRIIGMIHYGARSRLKSPRLPFPFRAFHRTIFALYCLLPDLLLSLSLSLALFSSMDRARYPRVSFLESLSPLVVHGKTSMRRSKKPGWYVRRPLSLETYISSHLVVKSNKVSGEKWNCGTKYANGNGGRHLSGERSHFSPCLPLLTDGESARLTLYGRHINSW